MVVPHIGGALGTANDHPTKVIGISIESAQRVSEASRKEPSHTPHASIEASLPQRIIVRTGTAGL